MRQRTTPRLVSISYSGAWKLSSTKGRKSTQTKRSRSVYLTRMIPSVTRVRKRQYVRASRSRFSGTQSLLSSSEGRTTSAPWIERTALLSSTVVSSTRFWMRAIARRVRRALRKASAASARRTATTAGRRMSARRLSQCGLHGVVEPARGVVEAGRRRLPDHHLRREAGDQRAGEARVDRRDERDPVRRQPWRQHRDAHDERRPVAA